MARCEGEQRDNGGLMMLIREPEIGRTTLKIVGEMRRLGEEEQTRKKPRFHGHWVSVDQWGCMCWHQSAAPPPPGTLVAELAQGNR